MDIVSFYAVRLILGANRRSQVLDQFIQDVSNKRKDEYGGSIKNRTRLTLRIVKEITEAIGQDRVGIRFSPWSQFQGMRSRCLLPKRR